jgi:hypothetical protein
MRIRQLAAGMGVVAAAFGGLVTVAPAATASPAAADGLVAKADVVPMSCPGFEPAPAPGFHCLSWYPTEQECVGGVQANIDNTPAVEGYCQPGNPGFWGYVR